MSSNSSHTSLDELAHSVRLASNVLKTLSNDKRTSALKVVHDTLRDAKDEIIEANKKDLELANKADLSEALIRRLDLTKGDKYEAMLQGILDVAALPDPVGKVTLSRHLDQGLDLYRVSCPLGVLLVIFEARPEVMANITALALKSGNAAILKGGMESVNTFSVMAKAIHTALSKTDYIPTNAIQWVKSREQVAELLKHDKYIDLVIPRGSNELVRAIKNSTKIPVLGHADGLCSIYVHKDADPDMAASVVVDSKVNYPAGCNAVETLLFDSQAPDLTVVKVIDGLLDASVNLRIAPDLLQRLAKISPEAANSPLIEEAVDKDFDTEFLTLTLAVKTVDGLDNAISHINEHGSHHTDAIITESSQIADKFLKGIDSAGVYWNASTRFADGFRYGFGTEVGISTNKIHARGPVGLEGIMSYQYQLKGRGQVVGDYVGGGGSKQFKHQDFVLDDF